jgi:hypothetical protein
MAERAASLVDAVLPRVPVRQWVLTLPYRLRYRLAWDHALCLLITFKKRGHLDVSATVKTAARRVVRMCSFPCSRSRRTGTRRSKGLR